MSKLNTENPTNSSVIQMLLDIQKCGIDIPDDLRKQITAKKEEIDDIWNSHQYPTESLVFTRFSRENSIAENLQKNVRFGETAVSLLDMIVKNIPQNLTFAMSVKEVAKIMGWSDSKVKRATKILREHGIIAVVQQGKRGNPTIYRLNPMVADVGKKKPQQEQEEFWELAGDWEARKYIDLAEKCVTVDEVKTEDKLKYSVFKYKTKEQQEDDEPEEETELAKKSIKKVESIQPLTAQQREEIDSTFSIRH